jgi:hypothetical protein
MYSNGYINNVQVNAVHSLLTMFFFQCLFRTSRKKSSTLYSMKVSTSPNQFAKPQVDNLRLYFIAGVLIVDISVYHTLRCAKFERVVIH